MFENVEQLEKEVQEFKENILASKELVRNLEQLVAATKAQQEQVAKSTDDLLRGIPASVEEKNNTLRGDVQKTADQMKADSEAAFSKALAEVQKVHQQHVDTLSAIETEVKKTASQIKVDNDTAIGTAIAEMQKVHQQHIEVLRGIETEIKKTTDKLCSDNQTVINSAVSKLQQTNQQHIDALVSVENEIKKFETDLTAKYADFVAKLEASNMDKIFTMCEELKKTVNSKLMLLFGGVGVSIVLSIVALIMK